MSHDDRIQQLTGLFLEDLRAPMEASFKQLLAQLVQMAEGDKATAIEEALTHARAEHQGALDEALAAAAREHDQALDTARAELARQHEAALETMRADLVKDHDAALETLRADLGREHAAALDALGADHARDREAAVEALRAELAAVHGDALGAARRESEREHQDALAALNADLALRHGQALDALRAEKDAEHDAAVQAAREELAREHEAEIDALRQQLQREHDEAAARERDARASEQESAMGGARAAAEAAAAVALAVVQQERDAARASVAELTDQLAAARAQHEQLTQLAHAEADVAAEMAQGVAVDTHVTERQSELACTEHVLAAMRALDEARSLSEVLTALAHHAASDGVRVAVLLVQGARLRGWRLAGMGDAQAAAVDVPAAQAGVIGRAVDLGLSVSSSESAGADATALPPFLATPAGRVGLALPILVGGRVVAVLYADNGASETPVVPSNWPELTEVLTRHAARCLEVLTLAARATGAIRPMPEGHPKTVQAGDGPASASPAALVRETEEQEEESARRHARLLISEIKLYNQELVERGRREANLTVLLGSEIERARRLYEEKIPAAVRQRVDCFDEEIVRTLAGGDRTLLGQVT